MATVTPVEFAASQLTGSASTFYTVPAQKKAVIKALTLTNTDASVAYTATVHLVTSGGSASVSNMILNAKSLAAGESYVLAEAIGQILVAGGTIQALASTTSKITMVASGLEIT